MPVDGFQVHHLSVPLARGPKTAIHDINRVENVVLELHADGLVGTGFAYTFNAAHARAMRELVDELAGGVVGAPVGSITDTWRRLLRRIEFLGHAGLAMSAVAAVDMAMWDLLARSAGLPLARLLGSTRSALPVYATGGWLSDPIELLVEDAQALQRAGYGGFKVKIGLPQWRDDIARLSAARGAVGGGFELMVDVNQGWTEWQARAAAPALAELDIRWLEEPLPAGDVDGNARLSRQLAMPVAGGEGTSTQDAFVALLRAGAYSMITPDVMKCGGPSGFLAVSTLAAAHHVPMASHTCTEISAHLVATCPPGTWVEHLPGIWDGLFADPLHIADGCVHLPDSAGAGMRLAPSMAALA
ncbi:MAG TPA: mandelate racemase/muconate lactonizing enzyme family protein [Candidatus Dormibacteraeota bacterium]|nr:mandelate racemase/muconate lactonizing enzyme family protein [Candidatus Dormibacteraeota bacterium]